MSVDLLPLTVESLRYEVRGRALIDHVSLTIETAGVTVVMGPNGAGKSILLRLLHGLIEPAAGTISWAGRPPKEDVRTRQAMHAAPGHTLEQQGRLCPARGRARLAPSERRRGARVAEPEDERGRGVDPTRLTAHTG